MEWIASNVDLECENMEPHDMVGNPRQSSFQALSPLDILPLHCSLQRSTRKITCITIVHLRLYVLYTHIKFLQLPDPLTSFKDTVDIQVENFATTGVVWEYLYKILYYYNYIHVHIIYNVAKDADA